MTDFFYIVTSLIVAVSVGFYIGFLREEGKDERDREILAKANQISYIFLFLGFVVQFLLFLFVDPTFDLVQLVNSSWMALVCGSNAVGILLYRCIL